MVSFKKNEEKMEKLTLPQLGYDYNALEPYISSEIMTLHHTKHHQTYINKFNEAVDAFILESNQKSPDPSKMAKLTSALNFNGGGAANHNFFFKILTPEKQSTAPSAKLSEALASAFGSFEKFKEMFSASATTLQGSGWAWLGFHPQTKNLLLETTQNQDNIAHKGLKPLLALDVWEHAYYLQYKNVRPDYIKNFWNIVHWDYINSLYESYLG